MATPSGSFAHALSSCPRVCNAAELPGRRLVKLKVLGMQTYSRLLRDTEFKFILRTSLMFIEYMNQSYVQALPTVSIDRRF